MILQTRSQKLIVNCDWMSFSGQLVYYDGEDKQNPEICCPDGCRLEVYDGTNVFKHRAILYDGAGAKLLTFLWSPKSRQMNKALINFEVANAVLYSNRLAEVIDLTFAIHPYQFLCCTRFDVCCDFEPTRAQRKLIDNLYRHRWYVANKHDGVDFWHSEIIADDAHCLNFGSKHSDFKWKLYNKSRELGCGTPKTTKDYIWQEWQAVGLNTVGVWRLEISATKGSTMKVNGRKMDVQDMVSQAFQVEFFGNMLEHRFVVRKGHKHTRKSNDEVVPFLPFPKSNLSVSTPVSKGVALEPKVSTQINKICEVMETPMAMVTKSVYLHLESSLTMLIAKYNLHQYFLRSKGMSLQSYLSEMRLRRDSQVVDLRERQGDSMAAIGDYVNACWLRKRWLEAIKKY